MAYNLDEKVSALVDGELSHDEVDQLIQSLKQDHDTQACWRHFHLISDALKNNLPERLPEDFVTRVSTALEPEPAHFSPAPRRTVKLSSLHAPTIGFALAASVAAVVFLGLGWNTLNQAPRTAATPAPTVVAQLTPPATTPTATPPATMAATPRATPPATPVSTVPDLAYGRVRGRQWDVQQPAVISKLNAYLISHDQYSLASGVRSGVLPQVRIVGYERVEPAQGDSAAGDGGR